MTATMSRPRIPLLLRLFYSLRALTERRAGNRYRRTFGIDSYSREELQRIVNDRPVGGEDKQQ
jgi:hypothetical protein